MSGLMRIDELTAERDKALDGWTNARVERDDIAGQLDDRSHEVAELRQELVAERARCGQLLNEAHNQLAVALGNVERLHAELARTVQTSHDREAALIDALAAVARSRT